MQVRCYTGAHPQAWFAALQARAMAERRDPARHRAVPGGSRPDDPPLTTRDCADWLGFSTEWVRHAIEEGQPVAGDGVVRLRAERLVVNGRRTYRIHLDQFIAFLEAIGWARIPRHAAPRRTPGLPNPSDN